MTDDRRRHFIQLVIMAVVSLSRVISLLFPAALLTAFLSFYHVTLLTNENCFLQDLFGAPSGGAQHKNATLSSSSVAVKQQEQPYTGPYKVYSKWKEPFPCIPAERQWKSMRIQRSPSREGEHHTSKSHPANVISFLIPFLPYL